MLNPVRWAEATLPHHVSSELRTRRSGPGASGLLILIIQQCTTDPSSTYGGIVTLGSELLLQGLIITNTILGVSYYNCSIMGPQTLF